MNRPSRRGKLAVLAILVATSALGHRIFADPLASPRWGFRIDLPEGYEFIEGDGQNRFSFATATGSFFDLLVYPVGRFASVKELAMETVKKLGAEADTSEFVYRGKQAALIELSFVTQIGPVQGWGLCIELESQRDGDAAEGAKTGERRQRPMLLALAYGADGEQADDLNLSALDSIAPTEMDRKTPGPIISFAFPSTGRKNVRIAGLEAEATIDASDAEAEQALINREFTVLSRYGQSQLWREAWTRFYRAIYRDAYGRLADIAFAVERTFNAGEEGGNALSDKELAERTLAWVQGFSYERNLVGSDFVDLVSAATEGRGDCDSRATLMAIILARSNVSAAIMVSRDYGHAMGLVAVEGEGARFSHAGRDWLVAETTAKVPLGMIGKNVSDPAKWLGIVFE